MITNEGPLYSRLGESSHDNPNLGPLSTDLLREQTLQALKNVVCNFSESPCGNIDVANTEQAVLLEYFHSFKDKHLQEALDYATRLTKSLNAELCMLQWEASTVRSKSCKPSRQAGAFDAGASAPTDDHMSAAIQISTLSPKQMGLVRFDCHLADTLFNSCTHISRVSASIRKCEGEVVAEGYERSGNSLL